MQYRIIRKRPAKRRKKKELSAVRQEYLEKVKKLNLEIEMNTKWPKNKKGKPYKSPKRALYYLQIAKFNNNQ